YGVLKGDPVDCGLKNLRFYDYDYEDQEIALYLCDFYEQVVDERDMVHAFLFSVLKKDVIYGNVALYRWFIEPLREIDRQLFQEFEERMTYGLEDVDQLGREVRENMPPRSENYSRETRNLFGTPPRVSDVAARALASPYTPPPYTPPNNLLSSDNLVVEGRKRLKLSPSNHSIG